MCIYFINGFVTPLIKTKKITTIKNLCALIYADISYYPDTTWVAAFIVMGIARIASSFIAVYTLIKTRKK